MGKKSNSLLGIVFANIVWGLSYVLSGELQRSGMGNASIIALRVSVAAVVLILIAFTVRSNMRIYSRRDFSLMLLMSVFQPVIYFFFELYAIKHTSPTFVSLLMCSVPVIVPLILYVTEKISPSPRLKYGIAISVIGVVGVIIGGGEQSRLIRTVWGALAMIGAVGCAIGYNFVIRGLSKRYTPLTITTYQNIFGAVLLLPIFFIFDYRNFAQLTITFAMVRSLVILGVVCSSLAYICYVNSVKNLGVSVTSMINNLSPIATAVGAYFIFGERLTWIQIGCIAVTIFGLIYGTTTIKTKKSLNLQQ